MLANWQMTNLRRKKIDLNHLNSQEQVTYSTLNSSEGNVFKNAHRYFVNMFCFFGQKAIIILES